ncbi:hypothetical protein DPMN_151723 [Dreissena polymorpha]|uniref:Uncharacterized protein n=1 Tax=Dreissena polymorpha TaxID=45954 RepID=A0A9D4FJ10_DREPO|nr:hypothetical protein DPMN_151723 [Dreissena polymorpha]
MYLTEAVVSFLDSYLQHRCCSDGDTKHGPGEDIKDRMVHPLFLHVTDQTSKLICVGSLR